MGAKKAKAKARVQTPESTLIHSEQCSIPKKRGGGTLKIEYYGYNDASGKQVITRYNIAWINHDICQKDNGRVLGYDNAHDYHHRHLMGEVEPVSVDSYEAAWDLFQADWQRLVKKHQGKDR